jgi:hypothetical protein
MEQGSKVQFYKGQAFGQAPWRARQVQPQGVGGWGVDKGHLSSPHPLLQNPGRSFGQVPVGETLKGQMKDAGLKFSIQRTKAWARVRDVCHTGHSRLPCGFSQLGNSHSVLHTSVPLFLSPPRGLVLLKPKGKQSSPRHDAHSRCVFQEAGDD